MIAYHYEIFHYKCESDANIPKYYSIYLNELNNKTEEKEYNKQQCADYDESTLLAFVLLLL